ncbi:MAG TPA: hypothetical protein VMM79_18470 [Longimicrobiales bacterium]|nr:hypothetical protein [Longimicrobiales bacterium]
MDGRFCGPPGTANGGYLAGLIGGLSDTAVQVTLRQPVPLDTDLAAWMIGDTVLVHQHDRLLVEAVASDLALDVPAASDFDTAVEASRRYVAFDYHPFPRCFVCGTQREPGDGLRIFAGPVADRELVASPWIPDASLADDNGPIPAAAAWAALDCPGAYAALLDRQPVAQVLGRIASIVSQRVAAGECCVVIGWPIGRDGRKHHVGTALVNSAGRVCAKARATWFDVERGRDNQRRMSDGSQQHRRT